MTHPVLRTSTALGLSLSLLQPGVAPAQEATIDPELRALCVASPDSEVCAALPEGVLEQILEEAEAAEPAAPDPAAPADGAVTPPDADPEPAPEALQDAPAEIVPGSTPPEPRPDPAPESAPETVTPDAAEEPAEPAVPEEPAPATEALDEGLDALEAEDPAVEPEAAAPEALAPEDEPATDPVAPADAAVPEEPEPVTEAPEDGLDAPEAEDPAAEPEAAAPEALAPEADPATDPDPATEALEEGLDALETEDPAGEATEPEPAAPDAAAPEPVDPEAVTDPAADPDAPDTAETSSDAPETPEPETEPASGEAAEETVPEADTAAGEAAAPEEEVLAPLDAEQEAAVEAISAEPEVAEAISVLERSLAAEDTAETQDTAPEAAAAVEAMLADPADLPEAETREVTEEMSRTSAEDVAEPVTLAAPTEASRERDGLTDFEQIGLGALAGLVVGMTVANNRVAATAPDRVVVVDDQGQYQVWRDDDALLRRPGVRDRIERFDDGSTVSTIFREDGARIVTVRDATGRAIRRDRIAPDGRVVTLFDDTRRAEPVRISALPAPRQAEIPAFEETDPDLLRRILAETVPAEVAGRFTLAQVRNIVELRRLAPELAVGPVTFATGSAAIRPEQAQRLAVMAGVMNDIIDLDPSEVFLIEGHTDAVGRRAYNLLLSDRRAESVALALAEYFDVPPENMVVQGYGERFLRVPTETAEPRNRRVTVRRVTDLIR